MELYERAMRVKDIFSWIQRPSKKHDKQLKFCDAPPQARSVLPQRIYLRWIFCEIQGKDAAAHSNVLKITISIMRRNENPENTSH